ncbi:hypothetical protein OG765_29325 [Streptomyces sp. NBC_00555]|uniref:hypothetical protein n=1 Tax=Streptomyces sp. NBC_00555 TaxID=2903662 RepID=UPI00224F481C|nr:hypothetical protein [Streptomyces sp. NBC_00555]MCX5015039.1 hypothetical protein [Streptomyces sp. NBC_00555]
MPPGHVAVDCPPTELRVGDQVPVGDRLVAIADLRCCARRPLRPAHRRLGRARRAPHAPHRNAAGGGLLGFVGGGSGAGEVGGEEGLVLRGVDARDASPTRRAGAGRLTAAPTAGRGTAGC